MVVGHGPSGHRLVGALRAGDTAEACRVTVLGEEPRAAYDRVALTSHLTEGADFTLTPHDASVSAPFVSPVRCRDLPGAFVYRTTGDLAALGAHCTNLTWSRRAAMSAIISSKPLSLQPACALPDLDVGTQVLEGASWLMPRQLDEGGGAELRRHMEALGMAVHAGAPVDRLEAGEDGAGVFETERDQIGPVAVAGPELEVAVR
ncbi:NAD-binding protein [Actinomadura logoneensis]|uniref:NAD-binding protein n=1 Tax=Actinomadura logoneensis TaxID=2293572 RepID=UPI001F15E37E|nr:NAD-binding protein [Actinomadura logoneensis]